MFTRNQQILIIGIVLVAILLCVLGFLLFFQKENFYYTPTPVQTSSVIPSVSVSSQPPQALISDAEGNLSLGAIVPVGGIIMWAGTVQQINNLAPKWVLCDGTNGTPDLRSRFIVGAASDSNGGAALSNPVNQLSDSANNAQLTSYQPNNYGGEEEHALTLREIPTNGTTNRSFEWNWGFSPEDLNKGSFSFPHNNMPPFYALAFIMKIAN